MISVEHLTKCYGDFMAVNDLSFEIEEGHVYGFLGPNGAGKSTVMGLISRLVARDAGIIHFEDKDLNKWKSKELAKKLALLTQHNNVQLKLTVRELVSFGRFPYSGSHLTKEDKEIVDKAIAYMELESIEDRFIDELSGGQRQRAYIAMVIAQNSDYILLDEPLNNLDMKHSVEIMKILRRLTDELGKTVIIVIHDINFASCYSDYIVALKDGKVVKDGPTDETIKKEELESIYEIKFDIQNIDNRKICVYF